MKRIRGAVFGGTSRGNAGITEYKDVQTFEKKPYLLRPNNPFPRPITAELSSPSETIYDKGRV